MATSSIFENFDIRDKKSAEMFAEALKSSGTVSATSKRVASDCKTISDPIGIKKFFESKG